jgi:hypothetical protein
VKVIVKRPNEKLEAIEVGNELEKLQQLVGGYIETIPYRDNIIILLDKDLKIVISEYIYSKDIGLIKELDVCVKHNIIK